MKNKQLRLFREESHYEPDCFLSGTPKYPDPLEVPIVYEPWQKLYERFYEYQDSLGKLALVSDPEPLPNNVIELYPKVEPRIA